MQQQASDAGLDAASVRIDAAPTLVEVVLGSGGFGLLRGGEPRTITRVGADYLESEVPERVLSPVGRSVVVSQPSLAPPVAVASSLLDELARAADKGPTVLIEVPSGRVRGRLMSTARDHVRLETWTGSILVALDAIQAVEFIGEG